MQLLVSGALKTVARYANSPFLGHLIVPAAQNKMETVFATGLPVGVDNGCFKALNRRLFLLMLNSLRGRSVLWVASPDVVADAAATLARFALWQPVIRYLGFPVAFVGQDGQENLPVPWDKFECLFIGGSTAWKESEAAFGLVREAKRRGKWVHIGRVNSAKRERMFAPLGADSIDGGQYSMFPDRYIPPALERMERYTQGDYSNGQDKTGRRRRAVPRSEYSREPASAVLWASDDTIQRDGVYRLRPDDAGSPT